VELAIESADLIILVVNAQEGVVALDREAANREETCSQISTL
jgi:predicted GTPase